MKQTAQEALEELLRRMGMDATVTSEDGEERIRLTIGGEDAALLIGKKGQTLDALQFLTNRMVRAGESWEKPIEVDAEGYRDRRADSLEQLAKRLSEKARESGEIVELTPMSPRDRRTVHMSLREMPGISTRSEGEGEDRRLLIVPE